jgi:predicted RNA-binding protein YlxR (DUF448 family)
MEAKKKKIPTRQCLGCGEHRPKPELLRVVRDPQGGVSLDFTGKKSGRGAYICKNVACLRQAQRRRALARNLECEIPDEVMVALEAQLNAGE